MRSWAVRRFLLGWRTPHFHFFVLCSRSTPLAIDGKGGRRAPGSRYTGNFLPSLAFFMVAIRRGAASQQALLIKETEVIWS